LRKQLHSILLALAINLAGASTGYAQGLAADDEVRFLIKVDDRGTRTIQIPWATLLMNSGFKVNEPCTDDGVHEEDVFAGDNLWVCNLSVANTGKGQLTLLDGGPASSRVIERRPISLRSAGALRMTVRVADGVAERKLKSKPSIMQAAFEKAFGDTTAGTPEAPTDEEEEGPDQARANQSEAGALPGALPEDAMVENASLFEETVSVDAVEWKRDLIIGISALLAALGSLLLASRYMARRLEFEVRELTEVVSRLNQKCPPAA